MDKVTFHLDPAVDALFPGQRAAQVAITLADGRVLEHFQPHRVGDPQLPLDDGQLEAKFHELAAAVMAGGGRYLAGRTVGDRHARQHGPRQWPILRP